jgi:hypothetical protein
VAGRCLAVPLPVAAPALALAGTAAAEAAQWHSDGDMPRAHSESWLGSLWQPEVTTPLKVLVRSCEKLLNEFKFLVELPCASARRRVRVLIMKSCIPTTFVGTVHTTCVVLRGWIQVDSASEWALEAAS